MKKVTSTETTYTFYGPGGIISEFTTSNAIATATAASSTDKCFYHTSDKLGSAVLVMNSNGVVIENNRTLPYGEAWLAADFAASSTNDKKFTTYQRDAESGLDYAMNRYDSSANGRFTSPDKGKALLYTPMTLNRYLYSTDDPVNGNDPDGNFTCPVCSPPPPDISSICTGGGNTQDPSAIMYCLVLLGGVPAGGGDSGGGTSPSGGGGGPQIDRNCVQNAIMGAAGGAGLNLSGFNLSGASVQLVGDSKPGGGTYGETELNISGSANAVQTLILESGVKTRFSRHDRFKAVDLSEDIVGKSLEY